MSSCAACAVPTARSYPGDEGDSNKKLQIGAGERRTVPAGHGFKTTATTDVAVGDDERNDAESERRQLERAAEQPGTKRRPTPAVTGDVARRRKRALTHDRGRNVLGSRQRQRWVHQLDELGELPKGAQRAETIKALGAQRQRPEAYAAAAARAAPRGGGRTAPARRGWDDDTNMVLSTAVMSPEAEEHGAKMTPRFPATGSKPTGPPAPSRPILLCLGHEVPNNKKAKGGVSRRQLNDASH